MYKIILKHVYKLYVFQTEHGYRSKFRRELQHAAWSISVYAYTYMNRKQPRRNNEHTCGWTHCNGGVLRAEAACMQVCMRTLSLTGWMYHDSPCTGPPPVNAYAYPKHNTRPILINMPGIGELSLTWQNNAHMTGFSKDISGHLTDVPGKVELSLTCRGRGNYH